MDNSSTRGCYTYNYPLFPVVRQMPDLAVFRYSVSRMVRRFNDATGPRWRGRVRAWFLSYTHGYRLEGVPYTPMCCQPEQGGVGI